MASGREQKVHHDVKTHLKWPDNSSKWIPKAQHDTKMHPKWPDNSSKINLNSATWHQEDAQWPRDGIWARA
jgi:hypothetical protein